MEEVLFQNKIILHMKLTYYGTCACDFLWQQWPLSVEGGVSFSIISGV